MSGNEVANLTQNVELTRGWTFWGLIHPCRVAGANEKLQPHFSIFRGTAVKSILTGSRALFAAAALSPVFWNSSEAQAATSYAPFDGEKTTWHDGFERYDYLMDETNFAIAPFKRPESEKFALGNPPKEQR